MTRQLDLVDALVLVGAATVFGLLGLTAYQLGHQAGLANTQSTYAVANALCDSGNAQLKHDLAACRDALATPCDCSMFCDESWTDLGAGKRAERNSL